MALPFQSRRSDVLTTGGCVAANHPLAARAGVEILQRGGNAADAAVAVAAALGVVEPTATGMGADAFCLFYNASDKSVKGLNGSGRAPAALTLDLVTSRGFDVWHPIPDGHGLSVTVPGAPAAWLDTLHNFGSGLISLEEILNPAIQLAEEGFPVTEIIAHDWNLDENTLRKTRFGHEMLLNGKAPSVGQMMYRPTTARTMRELLGGGKESFYGGHVAQAIVEEVGVAGGVLSLQDLAEHTSTLVQPISTAYKGVRLWEIPPNATGLTALEALNILENFDLKGLGHNSVRYLHLLIEAFKLSFADALACVADPAQVRVPVDALISKSYADHRRRLINPDKALEVYMPGDLPTGTDTTYLSVVDARGNACSFITSNYKGVGTGIVPRECGFSLQNRGLCFNLRSGHPDAPAPNKRPFHTIIPAMLTSASTQDLLACYGVMGGFMQPQGHVQVLLNMLEFGMSPQAALDQPRCFVNVPSFNPGYSIGPIWLEEGLPAGHVYALNAMGHQARGPIVGQDRAFFGRGNVIAKNAWWQAWNDEHVLEDTGPPVFWSGSDPRSDGCALPS